MTYSSSAPTTRRAIWKRASAESERGRRPTIRLCSRAKSVWIAVRAMFSFARMSPAANAKSAADDGVTYVQARYRENPVVVIAVGAAIVAGVVLVLRGIFKR